MAFWVYENWQRKRARAHVAQCSHCKDGVGTQGSTTELSGRWTRHHTIEEAVGYLSSLRYGEEARWCAHCWAAVSP